jgi:predicted nucleic acid-binding protein
MVIIGDADGLIALLQEDDVNHTIAVKAARKAVYEGSEIIFPLTAVIEATTTIQRKLSNPQLVERVVQDTVQGKLLIREVDKPLLDQAIGMFSPYGSKKNTLFDAVVAAFATKYNTPLIFSFDDWYTKKNFQIIPDYVKYKAVESKDEITIV